VKRSNPHARSKPSRGVLKTRLKSMKGVIEDFHTGNEQGISMKGDTKTT
jgi:hypothetical protein